jgi:serine/threonine-protein kinase RsbW
MQLALDLTLPTDTRLLAVTRKVLTLYLSEFGAPREVIDDVIWAMDEACSNVLKHAFPDRDSDYYRVHADLGDQQIMIEVCDGGVGFDLMSRPAIPDTSGGFAASGRGLEVMRRLMTTVEVESPTATGGTRLRLVRKLPPTAY